MSTMDFVDGTVHVRAPATSANLGPGYDSLGLALGLYDDVRAHVSSIPGIRVSVTGEGAGDLADHETHLVAASALTTFDRLGGRPAGLVIACANRIPQARGLGSSSAAIVAGVLLARALVVGGEGELGVDEVLQLASAIEGHPDNVAPCLFGGFTIAWTGAAGAEAVRLVPSVAVQPVIFIPDERGLTAHARAALPTTITHSDAAANAARAALLVHALTSDPSRLFAATEDRLHQSYRASAMPATAALVNRLRAAGIPAVVSGAGPSVLALTDAAVSIDLPDTPGWKTLSPGCDMVGASSAVDWQVAGSASISAGWSM
jgi:homoserine kinase